MKGCMRTGWLGRELLVAACLAIFLARPAVGELQLGSDFEPSQSVEQISVRITVSSEGEDLQEPVALDLGLGFPFWLHPLGREEGEPVFFGALPNRTDALHTARAGSTVEFTFQLTGEAGEDQFGTSSQLLADVRVSDVSRIGLLSTGDTAWILGAYEIEINGRIFAANDNVDASVTEQQEQTRIRLLEITPTVEPLQREAQELADLIEAGLSFDEDVVRLDEINDELVPLLVEQAIAERRLSGSYPWFEEVGFEPDWRRGESVGEAVVTLVTSPHTGAETSNYVYFRTGGHKYLLSSPLNPLSSDSGPQRFQLDLLGGPLLASDLRGHALGMLANGEPYGEAPDRWHPQRLLVEIDGRTVYDSEERELDRLSLEAIRLIPPAHLNAESVIAQNTPNARETFVWEAGLAQGLDLASGGVADLPPVEDPAFPEAEPGLIGDEATSEALEEVFDEAEWFAEDSLTEDPFGGFDPECEGFPGEHYPEDEIEGWPEEESFDGGEWAGGFDPEGDAWDDSGGGYGPGEWSAGRSWLDLLTEILGLVDAFDGIGDWSDFEPIPEGEPLQIHNVRFSGQAPGPVDVVWDVHGDESSVDYYDVQVVVLLPHHESHVVATVWQNIAPAGSRQLRVALAEAWANAIAAAADMSDADRALAYFAPVVTPNLVDPPGPGDGGGMGPARPALPASRLQAVPAAAAEAVFTAVDGTPSSVLIENMPPLSSGRAVWIERGELESHSGIVFENVHPGYHLIVRPETGVDASARVVFAVPVPAAPESLRVVAHVGFTGLSDVADSTSVRMTHTSLSSTGAVPPVMGEAISGLIAPEGPLGQLESSFDKPLNHDLLLVEFEFEGEAASEEHVPTLFGLRLLRQ